ncbi:MAG TPA: hypothetical protein VGI70_04845, partial [Polyangiales bacterium]
MRRASSDGMSDEANGCRHANAECIVCDAFQRIHMDIEIMERAQVNVAPHGGGFAAGLKIVAGVVGYRIRKLEMANLAAATSIALALRLSFTDVVVRTLFAFVLNALVYLNNDYIDVQIDLNSADKDTEKALFLAAHKGAARLAQWSLVALLIC